MLSHSHSKYRSIKYSTSSQNIHKVKTDAQEELAKSKSRLSLCKQNHSPFMAIGQRPKTPNHLKMMPLESRWGNLKPASSHYKLRIVASSSHSRTRCSEKEEQEVKKEEEGGFVLQCNQSPPFSGYYEHLVVQVELAQEQLAIFPSVLQTQRQQTDSIRLKLQLLKKQVESQLSFQQQRFRHQSSKLRLQMTLSFKNHSKQVINTRESILNLNDCFHSLQCSLQATSDQLQRIDDNFNA